MSSDGNWNERRVLVTGAGGFIGSQLTEQLITEGADVRAFVRYTSLGRTGFLKEIDPSARGSLEIVPGDLRDSDAVQKATAGVDVVFHLGALIGIPYSYVHPRETVDTNVIGTLNALTAARDHGVSRFVQTSSSEVYGSALFVPMTEAHPLQGQSPYSASKIAADKIAESFQLSYGLPVTTIRPFNTYGPRQSTRAVIPTIITQALRGNQIAIGNLEPTRDFTYVSDTVAAFLLAATQDAAVGRTINLGVSHETSVGRLVELIGEILGKQLEPQIQETRLRPPTSEVDRLLSDNSLAKELLGWIPKIELREGLEQTCRWLQTRADFNPDNAYSI